MAIRKRGDSWQIDVLVPTGEKDEEGREMRERIRKTFGKKKDADAEHDKIRTLVRENRYLDVKQDSKTPFKDLMEKYRENYGNQASFPKYKVFCLENFKDHFGEEALLSDIRYLDVESYQNHLRQKPTKAGSVRKEATINREMACLHHLFRKAVEWEMVEKSPFDHGKSLILKENNQRIRYLTTKEVSALLEKCRGKKHLYRIVICALNTGMRKGEILGLKWDQIRNGFIYLEKTKTKNRREIPVNEDLSQILKEIRKEQGLTSPHIFLYGKRTIDRVDRAFKGALRNAGIEDFTFHDLRHTFASHLVMRGASLKEIQELLGHKTMTMTLRYAHLGQEEKKKAVSLLNGWTSSENSPMSQNVTNARSRSANGKLTY